MAVEYDAAVGMCEKEKTVRESDAAVFRESFRTVYSDLLTSGKLPGNFTAKSCAAGTFSQLRSWCLFGTKKAPRNPQRTPCAEARRDHFAPAESS